ncbi:helix-turn-helix domain-containing protein [Streptomyces sp. TRM 70351]|uniref:PucR family transcriptional regulator n=1 Tax=Streptomyces sp. TRM 70351 TaxID=3116552 RepID=UPI002E7AD425|nr:helix-turn-helix domain-containing protein [Streptomyces sp. TRM 70351]MEE1928237.1 helix-turn-helix domain-containing protein [Streptomyces sp. TRM 70351]
MKRSGIPATYLGDYPRLLTEVSATGRLPRRAELDALRELGEQAAEDGHSLRELIGLYVGRTRTMWGTLPGVMRAAGAAERARTGDAILAALESAIGALGEGHEHARRLAVRQEEAGRREFIDDLLHGRSDLGRLAERAQRFGLRMAHAHAVAVATAEEAYGDVHPVVRRIERELQARFGDRDTLLTTKDGRLVCVAAASDRPVVDAFARLAAEPGPGYPAARRVVVGREHAGPGGVVLSYEEALNALHVADQLGLDAVRLSASELLVFPVLLRDRGAIADLVRTVLGPLSEARGGAEPLVRTLMACAQSGYVNAEAARRLGIGVRTLTYRLARVKSLTGYDPGDPLQRYTLETAAMGARLLDWPGRDF